jgi:exoribonuclease-2
MVNQRQIIAMLRDGEPAYEKNDTALYAAMRDFDTMYTIYNDFQRHMERYWCLRWLQQERADAETPSPQPSPTAPLPPGGGGAGGEGAIDSLRELLVDAVVLRENLVKVAGIPLIFRAPSLPELPANTRVQLAIVSVDLLDLDVQTRFVATVDVEAAA